MWAPENGLEIAIIGMNLRFPGAADEGQFWQLLRNGEEAIRRLEPEQIPAEMRTHPNFVGVSASLQQPYRFDAPFFGYSPREAQMMDPQQRVWLECCWQALEDAGYNSLTYTGSIGVYGGAGMNWYLEHLREHPQFFRSISGFEKLITSDKDFLPTRVAYHLGLKGPAVNLQTACSTSLVAVHAACQGLLSGDCDMALAGAVAISPYEGQGYLYQEGMIMSPDGHCRPYDARAGGTVFSNGAAVVVLKRLSEARQSRDNIRAVIKGTAINNDGARKVGYTAPSVEGQAEVIQAALRAAQLDPASITYVEGHGTATELGDPVEVAALNRAFASVSGRGVCGLGSVKSNIGHLDTVAGLAGLIKVVLAMEHGQLPASLHFEQANPMIHFEQGPFYVVSRLTPWQPAGLSRRAGISSFGIGGTNAHVVLEEAPPGQPGGPSRSHQLVLCSARTRSALDTSLEQLCRHNLDADAAYTLAVGRRALPQRAFCLVSQPPTARPEQFKLGLVERDSSPRPVVLLFPGQGAQHPGMAREIYEQEPLFRELIDQGVEILNARLGCNVLELLYPTANPERAAERWKRPDLTVPTLFMLEYALARLLQHWGVPIAAMLGHSNGEYVCACLAGVFDYRQGLEILARRGALMDALPTGAMLAVARSAEEVSAWLGPGLSLAAVNAPGSCVISGTHEAIAELAQKLEKAGVSQRLLPTSHAFHSEMIEPAQQPFAQFLQQFSLQPAKIPYISNLTGDWIDPESPRQVDYWLRHLREPVRFSEGLERLAADLDRPLLVEVGPGNSLTSLARLRRKLGFSGSFASLPSSQKEDSAMAQLLGSLGQLWLHGQPIDWEAFYEGQKRRRVGLPVYPFEGQSYEVSPESAPRRLEELLYVPGWKRLPPLGQARPTGDEERWLVFLPPGDTARQLLQGLGPVCWVTAGADFSQSGEGEFQIDPARPEHYQRVVQASGANRLVYAWSLRENEESGSWESDFFPLLYLVQALQATYTSVARKLVLLSHRLQEVVGEPVMGPERASILGLQSILAQECTRLTCRSLDLTLPEEPQAVLELARQLAQELPSPDAPERVALRGGHRWGQTFEPLETVRPEGLPSLLRAQGVYLITGGSGAIGLVVAEYLAEKAQARLVLTHRGSPPDPQVVARLEGLGAEVLLCQAEVSDEGQVARVVEQALQRFGSLHGVFHAAGVGHSTLIQDCSPENCQAHFAAKLIGARLLERNLLSQDLDFFCSFSSLAAFQGKAGLAAYAAANACLDAWTESLHRPSRTRYLSINWGPWKEVGMLRRLRQQAEAQPQESLFEQLVSEVSKQNLEQLLAEGFSNQEALEALERILHSQARRVLVATSPVPAKPAERVRNRLEGVIRTASREKMSASFSRATTPTEETVLEIWKQLLGFEELGVDDDFFELGGHSLLAAQILARVNPILGVKLPMRSLFEARTVAQMSSLIDNLRWAAQPAVAAQGEREEFIL